MPRPGSPHIVAPDVRVSAVGGGYQVEVFSGGDWRVHRPPMDDYESALFIADKVSRRERGVRPEGPAPVPGDWQPDSDPDYQPKDQRHPDKVDMVGLAAKIRRARQLKGLRA